MNDIGSYLKRVRRLADLTLRDVSTRGGPSNAYLCQIEQGQRRASIRTLNVLSGIYNVPLAEMLARGGYLEAARDQPVEKKPLDPLQAAEGAVDVLIGSLRCLTQENARLREENAALRSVLSEGIRRANDPLRTESQG